MKFTNTLTACLLTTMLLSPAANAKFIIDMQDLKIDFAKCYQKATYSIRNSESTLSRLITLTEDYKSASTLDDFESLQNRCESIRKEIARNPKIRKEAFRREAFENASKQNASSADAKGLVLKMFSPYMNCDTAAIRAQATLGIGVVAGIGGGHCESSNGMRFTVLTPIAGLAVGGFVGAFVSEDRIFSSARGILNSEEDQTGISMGLLAAQTEQFKDKGTDIGVGVGLSLEGVYINTLKVARTSRGLEKVVELLEATKSQKNDSNIQ